MSEIGQTFREWIVDHWRDTPSYQSLLARVARTRQEIADLERDISTIERGEIPESRRRFFEGGDAAQSYRFFDFNVISDHMMAKAFGQDPKEIQTQRWEREALEAEEKRKSQISYWLETYRDGKLLGLSDKPLYGSLPYLKQDLNDTIAELESYKPEPLFDWRYSAYNDDSWYEKCQSVLSEMLYCIGWKTGYDFNDSLANVIDGLGKQGFSIALWIGDHSFATCKVQHREIKASPTIERAFDLWEATILALLDFINLHWSALYSISKEPK